MLDSFSQLVMGLGIALEPTHLAIALLGAILGTAVGVLPGLGPSATVSLLLPVTMMLDQTGAIILLAGIYYGSLYGGSITSVLMRVPGEAASLVSCFDGYPMAQQGRAGAALGISAFGSFIAGISATLAITIVGPAFTSVALAFGPIEKTSIVALGLVLAASIGEGSRIRAWTMVSLGLLLSTVGVDLISGEERFAFGVSYLRDGFNIAVLAMGLFGVSEMLMLIERRASPDTAPMPSYRLRDLLPTANDWKVSTGPIARGTVLGFFLGLMPAVAHSLPVSRATCWRKRSPGRRNVSARARSKASRDRKAPTTLPPRQASFLCSALAFRPMRSSASSWARC